ncbi:MAG: hypothetical protein ACK570_00315 [Bacteroidota bacterium]
MGEHSLIALVYNLRRTITILGTKDILEKLKNWKPDYKGIVCALRKQTSLEANSAKIKTAWRIAAKKTASFK